MSELDKKIRKVGGLRETNAGLLREIESYGGELDISVARLEHFFDNLVEIGVLTNEQRWDEQERWERSLRGQLLPVRDRMRIAHQKRQAEAKQLQERQAKAQQNKLHPSGLIIPE